MKNKIMPISRSGNIVVQEYDCEILIYDLLIHNAYSLNETTSRIWKFLDGKTSVETIVQKSGLPKEIVFLALEQLQKKDLLQEKVEIELPADSISRRKLLVKIGATSVILPIIASVVAPQAIHAASGCLPLGTPNQSPGCLAGIVTIFNSCAADSNTNMACVGSTFCTSSVGFRCTSSSATAGPCTTTGNSLGNGPGCSCFCN